MESSLGYISECQNPRENVVGVIYPYCTVTASFANKSFTSAFSDDTLLLIGLYGAIDSGATVFPPCLYLCMLHTVRVFPSAPLYCSKQLLLSKKRQRKSSLGQ